MLQLTMSKIRKKSIVKLLCVLYFENFNIAGVIITTSIVNVASQ